LREISNFRVIDGRLAIQKTISRGINALQSMSDGPQAATLTRRMSVVEYRRLQTDSTAIVGKKYQIRECASGTDNDDGEFPYHKWRHAENLQRKS
jgi:hypothetical protein